MSRMTRVCFAALICLCLMEVGACAQIGESQQDALMLNIYDSAVRVRDYTEPWFSTAARSVQCTSSDVNVVTVFKTVDGHDGGDWAARPVGVGEAVITVREAGTSNATSLAVRVYKLSSNLTGTKLVPGDAVNWMDALEFEGIEKSEIVFDGDIVDPDGMIRVPVADYKNAYDLCVSAMGGIKQIKTQIEIVGLALDRKAIALDMGGKEPAQADLSVVVPEYFRDGLADGWAVLSVTPLDRRVATVAPIDGENGGSGISYRVTATGEGETELVARLRAPSEGVDVRSSVRVNVVRSGALLRLNRSDLSLDVGGTFQLKALAEGDGADGNAAWAVEEGDGVVSVDGNGRVTAEALGQAVVLARLEAGGEALAARCRVSVETTPATREYTALSGLSVCLGKEEPLLAGGAPVALCANLEPRSADEPLLWASGNPRVAIVDEEGVLTPIAPGIAVITATGALGGASAKLPVTVLSSAAPVALAFSPNCISLPVGESRDLSGLVQTVPSGVVADVAFSGQDGGALKLSGASVTALRPGVHKVTATMRLSGKEPLTASLTVLVPRPEAARIVFDAGNDPVIEAGGSVLWGAAVEPEGADQLLEWTSSEPSVARVYGGRIFAVEAGTATIRASSASGAYREETVTVTPPHGDVGVALWLGAGDTWAGEEVSLAARMLPSLRDAVDAVYYLNGALLAGDTTDVLGAGEYHLSVKVGGLSDERRITVKARAENVAVIAPDRASVEVGETLALAAVVTPEDAQEALLWASSDARVASVDQDGRVKAHAPGDAVITARTIHSGVEDTVALTVTQALRGVLLPDTVKIPRGQGTVTLKPVALPLGAALGGGRWQVYDEENSRWADVEVMDDGAIPVTLNAINVMAVRYYIAGLSDNALGRTIVQGIATPVTTGIRLEGFDEEADGVIHLQLDGADAKINVSLSSGGAYMSAIGHEAQVNADGAVVSASYDASAGCLTLEPLAPGNGWMILTSGGASIFFRIEVRQDVTGVVLPDAIELPLGGVQVLTPVFAPAGYDGASFVKYDVRGGAVREKHGVLYAVETGEASVTAVLGNLRSAPMRVCVYERAGSVAFGTDALYVALGASEKAEARFLPTGTKGALAWASSDEGIATVDEDGCVSGVGEGRATITARLENGMEASLAAHVCDPSAAFTDENQDAIDQVNLLAGGEAGCAWLKGLPTGVKLLMANDAQALCGARIDMLNAPDGLADCRLTLTPRADVSDATSTTGRVTLRAGGRDYPLTVTVRNPVRAVELEADGPTTLQLGDKRKLTARLTPARNTGALVTYETDNEFVLRVDPRTGDVNAQGFGSGSVNALVDGVMMASMTFYVEAEEGCLTLTDAAGAPLLNEMTAYMGEGDVRLGVEFMPDDGSRPDFAYLSSNRSVAQVREDGAVALKAPGEALISVHAPIWRGDAVLLKVKRRADGMTLKASGDTLAPGEQIMFTSAFEPSGAVGESVRYRVMGGNGAELVCLTQEGVLGLKAGAARDGNVYEVRVAASAGVLADQLTVHVDLKNHLTITAEPGDVNTREGEISGVLRVAARADEGEPAYQWYAQNGAAVDGATAAEFTLPQNLTEGVYGFFCRVSAPNAKAVDSRAAKVTVEKKQGGGQMVDLDQVSGIELSATTAAVGVGGRVRLGAKVTPDTAKDRSVVWTSGDKNIVTVDGDGLVTGVSEGEATVTAASGNGAFARCAVTVTYIPIDGLSMKPPGPLKEGQKVRLACAWSPENATKPALLWSSGAPDVASVDAEGLVSALTPGETVITAATNDGAFQAKVDIVVIEAAEEDPDPAEELGLWVDTLAVGKGKRLTLPKFKGYEGVWAVADESVARIINGRVVGFALGETRLTFTVAGASKAAELNGRMLAHGQSYPVTLLVRKNGQLPTGVVLTPKRLALDLFENNAAQLTAKVRPAGKAQVTKVFFSSTNPAVATVDAAGRVQAVAPGTAKIYVYCANLKRAQVKVTVAGLIRKIKIADITGAPIKKAVLKAGETLRLTALFNEDAVSEKVEWSSSAPRIASVEGGGIVTAQKKGKAVITVRALDGGGAKAKVTITVK